MTQDNLFDGWGDPDEFKFGSGLKDDYDGEIVGATFGYDAQYNSGKTLCLILEVKDLADGEIVRTLYPTGTNWTNADGGRTAVREDGKQTGFNKQTAVVELLTAIVSCEGNREAREYLVPKGFKPTYCPPLVGSKWHWSLKERTFSIKKDGKQEAITSTRPMPVAFLGGSSVNGDGNKTVATGRKKKNSWDKLSDDDIQAFKEVAAECETHDDFISTVNDEFEDVPEDVVMDPKFWAFLKG